MIVLPCGAGKSLVGVAASSRIKKSVLCLVTNSVSVDQWKHQFKLWTGLQDHQISRSVSFAYLVKGAMLCNISSETTLCWGKALMKSRSSVKHEKFHVVSVRM